MYIMSNVLPIIGAFNGVAGNPVFTKADPAFPTTIAVMYNYYDPLLTNSNASGIVTSSSNIIVLEPYGVSPKDFKNFPTDVSGIPLANFLALFYPTNSGYFSVNQSNRNNPAVILSSQTYTTTTHDGNKFSLVQYLLKSYCAQKGLSVNSLDPRIMVLLQKECFPIQSLASVTGTTISMSWDEVIHSFISSGVIDPSGNSASVVLPLSVVLNVHSFVLDIDLSIKFVYYVNIPGYTASPTPVVKT